MGYQYYTKQPMNNYNNLNNLAKQSENIASWLKTSFVIAIIAGLVLYFTFLSKKNEGKYKGFLAWTYDFLNFKKMLAETLLRIGYVISSIFITLFSFAFISVNMLSFVLVLVLGNIILRIIYETILIALVICRNTTEINNKMKNINEEKKIKEEKENKE